MIRSFTLLYLLSNLASGFLSYTNLNKYNCNYNKLYVTLLDNKVFSFLKNESHEDIRGGIDGRYGNNTEPVSELITIYRNNELSKILKKLQNENINDLDKVKIIKENYILESNVGRNIYAGGLMDDWEYEI